MSRRNLGWAAATTALALGWTFREATFASAQGKRLPNGTITAIEKPLADAPEYAGKPTGKVAIYLDGSTATCKTLHAGRFQLLPGAEPHAPHKHPEEEILIVSRGMGEIICDGKSIPVQAGSMMYCDPNVEHGIKNTGQRPLEFYWVKYAPEK